MSDYITPATQEQIARQVADAKKLNGNASLWDIENRRVVRTLANDRDRLAERVRILREAMERFADFPVDGNENECAWKALDEIEREAKAVLEAAKEGA